MSERKKAVSVDYKLLFKDKTTKHLKLLNLTSLQKST